MTEYDSYVAAGADPDLLKDPAFLQPSKTARPLTTPSSTTRALSTLSAARAPTSSAARWTPTPIPSLVCTSPAWRTEACSARLTAPWAAPAPACRKPRDAWPPRRWSSTSPTLKRSLFENRPRVRAEAKRNPPLSEKPSPGGFSLRRIWTASQHAPTPRLAGSFSYQSSFLLEHFNIAVDGGDAHTETLACLENGARRLFLEHAQQQLTPLAGATLLQVGASLSFSVDKLPSLP